MHRYLKAIGFGNIISYNQINELLREVTSTFSHHERIALEPEADYLEYWKDFGPDIGIALCGIMDNYENFDKQYYFPYFRGKGESTRTDMIVDKRPDREAYVGICEDLKIGINLIFHLQNATDYLKEDPKKNCFISAASVSLAGLCEQGTILLPVKKNTEQKKQQREEIHQRIRLMNAAREGDQSAMESLTLDEIDTYSKVSMRLYDEDVFSIVDTYIMPYGVECDQYSVMGEILELSEGINILTRELLYFMTIEVNDLLIDVCVPAGNLMGEPKIGRRFKGNLWLQGYLNLI
ncbi:MAG: DUF3881 family protein [Lachnospiraceae bacterium]|jgi:hypothetical protein|nr:DUF3881 family protein [Lachnospiraceae bacterium]